MLLKVNLDIAQLKKKKKIILVHLVILGDLIIVR